MLNVGELEATLRLRDELSKQASTAIEKVKSSLGTMGIAAGAAAAAFSGVSAAIVGLGSHGSQLLGVEDSFNRLAIAAGSTGDALLGKLTEGVKGTVDSMVLMQAVTRTLSAGVKLSADDMAVMGEAARAMGKATGTDAASGLATLSDALLTGRTRALAMTGIVVDTQAAEDRFAKSLGATANQLSETGKVEAHRLAILASMRDYVDRMGISELSFGERLQQVRIAIGDWTDSLSKSVASSPHVLSALDAITKAVQQTFGNTSQTLLETLVGWINRFADAVAYYGPMIIRFLGEIRTVIVEVWRSVQAAWSIVPQWFQNITKEAGLTAAAVYVAVQAFSVLGGDTLLTTAASLATVTSGLQSLGQMLAGSTLLFPLRVLVSQISIFGLSVGVSTTAVYLWEKSLQAATVAARTLWAALLAHPLVAVTAALGAATLAIVTWMNRSASAALAAQELGAKQDVINKAIAAGAPSTITYADAVALMNEQFRVAQGRALDIQTALAALSSNTGNTATQLRDLEQSVMALSRSGGLSTPVMRQVADAVRATGVASKDLPPALRAIVTASDVMSQSMRKTTGLLKDTTEEMKQLRATVKTLEHALTGIPSGLDQIGTHVDMAKLGPLIHQLAFVEQNARIANFGFQGMAAELDNVGEKTVLALDAMDGWAWVGPKLIDAQERLKGIGEILRSFPDMLIKSFQGGGGITGALQSLGVELTKGLTSRLSETTQAIGQAIGAGVMVGLGIAQGLVAPGGKGQQVVSSAMQGAQAGAAGGGIGIGIGAGIGALIGALKVSPEELQIRKVLADLAIELDKIATVSQKFEAGSRDWATVVISVRDAYRLVGVSAEEAAAKADAMMQQLWAAQTPEQAADVAQKIRDAIEAGASTTAAMLKDMGAIGSGAMRLISLETEQAIQRSIELGQNVDQIRAFYQRMGQAALQGFAQTMQGASLSSQQALEDLGTQAVRAFAAAVASGTSFYDALQVISPSLAKLQQEFVDLGISTGNAALGSLLMANTIAQSAPAAISAVQGIVATSQALYNMHLLDADTLVAMERTGAQAYAALQAAAAAAGGTTRDALLPMQEWLHTAAEEAARLNIPLDATTAEMIEQSRQLGIWQERGPGTQELMVNLTQELVRGVEDLVSLLTDLVQDSPFGKTGEDVLEVNTLLADTMGWLNQIPASLPDPFANWTMPQIPNLSSLGTVPPPIGAATGGNFLVTKPTLFLAGEAGPEQASFTPLGMGRGGTAQTIIVQTYLDGRQIAEAVVPELPGVVKRYGLHR